jgi:predicted transcriptional regulator of viral defense system
MTAEDENIQKVITYLKRYSEEEIEKRIVILQPKFPNVNLRNLIKEQVNDQ